MATNFGFLPVTTGGHYFISYNTEDAGRVQPIVQSLNGAGVPLWYDYGLEYGEEWERQIAKYIHSAKAVIMFITGGIFKKERSYVRKEYKIAEMYEVKIICVFLDSINARTIPEQYAGWWQDMRDLQGVEANRLSTGQIAGSIMYALGIPIVTANPSQSKPQAAPRPVQPTQAARQYHVGEIIKFGRYPQSTGTPEPIEWRVLEVRPDGSALVIAKHGLDCVKYNESRTSCTWETCSLRRWLNSRFIEKAFTSDERSRIVETALQNPDNPDWGTKGGNPTTDRVFCLSIDEARSYFKGDKDGICFPTAYAKKRGAYQSDTKGKGGRWWLRSPGSNACGAAGVHSDGYVNSFGFYADYLYDSVRPALALPAL